MSSYGKLGSDLTHFVFSVPIFAGLCRTMPNYAELLPIIADLVPMIAELCRTLADYCRTSPERPS